MEVKTSSGVLFKNNRKKEEKHPDYTGTWVDEQGVERYLDGYINESKNGNRYIKLRVGKPKVAAQQQEQQQRPAYHAPAKSGFEDMENDIPF